MKKLIIGRNNACDIIVPDTTDLVSRRQAVLTYGFWGKMVLYDTSNNGTYVNGQRLENGKGIRVTRKDTVSFARVVNLDWNDVKDPYRQTRLFTLIGAAAVALIGLLLLLWLLLTPHKPAPEPIVANDSIEVSEDSLSSIAVPAAETPAPKPLVKKKAPMAKKGTGSRNHDEDLGEKTTQSMPMKGKEEPIKQQPKEKAKDAVKKYSGGDKEGTKSSKEVNDKSPIVY